MSILGQVGYECQTKRFVLLSKAMSYIVENKVSIMRKIQEEDKKICIVESNVSNNETC